MKINYNYSKKRNTPSSIKNLSILFLAFLFSLNVFSQNDKKSLDENCGLELVFENSITNGIVMRNASTSKGFHFNLYNKGAKALIVKIEVLNLKSNAKAYKKYKIQFYG